MPLTQTEKEAIKREISRRKMLLHERLRQIGIDKTNRAGRKAKVLVGAASFGEVPVKAKKAKKSPKVMSIEQAGNLLRNASLEDLKKLLTGG